MDITLALQRAVRAYPHGTQALAAAMGMSATTLNHKTSPTYPTQFCSPEEMLQLMEITGDDGALHALAHARHCVLVPLPQRGEAGGDETLTALLLDAVREFAEATEAVTKAVQEKSAGKREIKANELATIESEGTQAIAAIQQLMAWAARAHEDTKPAHLRAVA